jgi:hypothetical protein
MYCQGELSMVLMDDIINRIKKYLKIKEDAKIARVLLGDVKNPSQQVRSWRERNTIPWEELFAFAQKQGLSFNWLLTGKEATQEIRHQEEIPPQSINLIAKLIDQLDKRLEEQGKRLDEQGKRIDAVIELSKQPASELKPAQGRIKRPSESCTLAGLGREEKYGILLEFKRREDKRPQKEYNR